MPTSVFWPGEFHGLYSPWGGKESDTTERLSLWDVYFMPTGTIHCHETVREVSCFSPFCADLQRVDIHYIFVKYTPKVWVTCEWQCKVWIVRKSWFCLPRDLQRYLETVSVVTIGWLIGGSYWHPWGRGWGCCWTSYNAQGSPYNNKLSNPACQ